VRIRQAVGLALITSESFCDAAAVSFNPNWLPSVLAHHFGKPTKERTFARAHWDFQGVEALLARNVLTTVPVDAPFEPAGRGKPRVALR
jgi:hypothetical protein